jgi:hypothetical protein
MGSIEITELHAPDEGLIANDTVSVKSILKYRTGFQFGKLRIIHKLRSLRVDRPSSVWGHGYPMCLGGATRLLPVFIKVS